MPRLPYLSDIEMNKAPLNLVESLKSRHTTKQFTNLDRNLLYSEPVSVGWVAMFHQLRKKLSVPPRLLELIAIRIALVTHASFVFSQHYPLALEEGVSVEKINELQEWQHSALFDDQERAVLAYSDAMTVLIDVPDTVFESLSQWFNEKEIVEITALVAGYNMVSRFLCALKIDTN
jgi:AhpD family alkylhydroperoxidase